MKKEKFERNKQQLNKRTKMSAIVGRFVLPVLPILLALLASPSYASDWEEYALVCGYKEGAIVWYKDGEKKLIKKSSKDSVIGLVVWGVNKMIEDDWQPLGDVSISIGGTCQTMVKD